MGGDGDEREEGDGIFGDGERGGRGGGARAEEGEESGVEVEGEEPGGEGQTIMGVALGQKDYIGVRWWSGAVDGVGSSGHGSDGGGLGEFFLVQWAGIWVFMGFCILRGILIFGASIFYY